MIKTHQITTDGTHTTITIDLGIDDEGGGLTYAEQLLELIKYVTSIPNDYTFVLRMDEDNPLCIPSDVHYRKITVTREDVYGD